MNKPFKVLLVEDRAELREIINLGLQGKPIQVLEAETIPQAEEIFAAHSDLAAILMDACVPGIEPNTPPLVIKFRETFRGPMIAISSNEDFRKKLMKVGCDHEAPKHRTAQKLLEILGL